MKKLTIVMLSVIFSASAMAQLTLSSTTQTSITNNTTDFKAVAITLKSANTSVGNAAAQLKTTHKAAADKCFQALVGAGYDTLQSGRATATVYTLSAHETLRSFPTLLSTTAPSGTRFPILRLRITKTAHPNLTFEQMVDAAKGFVSQAFYVHFFGDMCKTFHLANQQVIQKGLQFNLKRTLQINGRDFPNAKEIYDVVKTVVNPSTDHFALYALIINGGYNVAEIGELISIGILSATNVAADNVAVCMQQRFLAKLGSFNAFAKTMELQMNSDGTFAPVLNRDCFKLFADRMKAHNVSRANMFSYLNARVKCTPEGSSLCSQGANNLVNGILNDAGFLAN